MTVSVKVAVWVRLPDAPVTVTVAGPTVAALEAVNVSALVVVALAGLKDAVTPAGSPLAEGDRSAEAVERRNGDGAGS